MELDWHPAKCTKNIAERGIDFADVLAAFVDPDRKLAEDTRKDYGEIRINARASRWPDLPHHLHRTRRAHLDHLRAKGQQAGATVL